MRQRGGRKVPGHLDLRDIFAANLRRIRNAKGMSQDDVAYEVE
jgi:hypothetical protein